MAFTGKLAKVVAVTTAIGTISLAGVVYKSKQGDIQGFIDGLKQKALAWQTQSNKNKQAYDNLKAQYDEVIRLLGLDANASFDEIKAKIENLVKNTDVAGIDQTNAILKSIADSLGVTLTKDENGLYNPQPIYDELANLQTSLDNLQSALGDTTTDEDGNITININKNANGTETYSDDMTLTQKINYLIGQINKANSEQVEIRTYASEANEAVADVTSADKAIPDKAIPNEETPLAKFERVLRANASGISDDVVNALVNDHDNYRLHGEYGVARKTGDNTWEFDNEYSANLPAMGSAEWNSIRQAYVDAFGNDAFVY